MHLLLTIGRKYVSRQENVLCLCFDLFDLFDEWSEGGSSTDDS